MIKSNITHIDVQDNIFLFTVDGISNENHNILKIFKALAGYGIDVDMISMSVRHKNRMDLSFTIADDNIGKAVSALGELRKEIPKLLCHISGNNAKIILTGTAIYEEMNITANILEILAKNEIPVKLICASVNEISLLVDETHVDTAFAELSRIKQ